MKLTEAERALLIWLADASNCDVPMTEEQLVICDRLGPAGYCGFVRSTDGNYVTITPVGRAALVEKEGK